MIITTIVAWTGWFSVINNVDPETANLWGFVFFYLSLFLSLLGTFSVLGYLVRYITQGNKRGSIYKVSTAFRQAFLWALAINVALALQSQRLLPWWGIIILVLVFAMIEFTFLSLARQREDG